MSNFPKLPEFDVPELVVPQRLSPDMLQKAIACIDSLLKEKNAILITHYYTPADVQAITEATGGCVADSLKMARFGNTHSAQTLIVLGVKFMGETAKILNPEKKVLMPTLEATCSLDLNCPADLFSKFRNEHKDRTAVVYANTSAAVKACADWVVTSSNAVQIVQHLDGEGEKILWASDRYLGDYIQQKTEADMLLWPGSCVVHEQFKAEGIKQLKKVYPDAAILVHPESPREVIDIADAVGSTTQILQAAQTLSNKTLIIATEEGLFYQLQKLCPDKKFIQAPTGGHGATCKSCARCPWMLMNTVKLVELCLQTGEHEIHVEPNIIKKAQVPLQRMIEFTE